MLEILEIENAEDFDVRVINGPREQTFIVDFWAEWCGPCRTLAPALERAVAPFSDRATLVKVNVDDNRELGQRFNVQGIPSVKAFRAGAQLGEFVGALPENEVRRVVAEWIPSEADDRVAEAKALIEQGDEKQAEAHLREALKLNPDHGLAAVLMAERLLARGQISEAIDLAEGVTLDSPQHERAQTVLARAEFARVCHQAGGRSACALRYSEQEGDWNARYRLACCMAAEEDFEPALDLFLECVAQDRRRDGEAARRAMLAIFATLGADHPLTEDYRTRLSRVLFC